MNDKGYADYLDRLADTHRDRLILALQELEDRVATLLLDAPLSEGALFDLAWATGIRSELRAALDDTFLLSVNEIVTEYADVEVELAAMLQRYGGFRELPPEIIAQLQRLSFAGFEEIASTYLDTIANGVYQNTLTGRPANDVIKEMRQVINGVYIQSDQDEIAQLVEVANFGSAEDSKEAIERLHTKYASDRTGNNLRRYATQQVQDSLMQFSASSVVASGKEAGVDRWRYYGSTITDSRSFCREHAGKVYTTAEIYEIWGSESWQGKAAGDPFVVRGGYNCRHHFRPVVD